MAQQQQGKKGKPKSASLGSQKSHKAYPARKRHPDRVLRRIIQSSGFLAAQAYADKYGLVRVLTAIQSHRIQAESGFLAVPVRWIERKMAEAQRGAEGFAPVGYHCGRALRRWQEFGAKQTQTAETPPAA